MRLTRRRFLGLAAAGAVAGTGYAIGVEPTWLKTVRRELGVPGLPDAFDGYTIAHLSDLHIGSGVSLGFLDGAVAEANAARPDLAVVTGDIVDGCSGPRDPDDAARVLSGLRPRDAAWVVFGNHDTGAVRPGTDVDDEAVRRLTGSMQDAGVGVLRNRVHAIERDGTRVLVAGLGDLWSGWFDPKSTLRHAARETTVALSHNPDTAPELAALGADVILSGHTHGGQVCVPLLGPPYVPVRHKEYVRGHFRVGESAHLYVNPGLGFSYRVRFCARPEVTILKLRCL